MGKKKQLTSEERAQINILRKVNPQWSGARIAQEILRSPSTVNRYLKNPENYGRQPRSGRPRVIPENKRRRISGLATNQLMKPKEIINRLDLNCTPRTILNVLAEDPNVIWAKMAVKPPLESKHKMQRMEFAVKHISLKKKMQRIVFSDEKKWNLDGPDRNQHYWHDLRNDKKTLSRRRFGGGSVMVWAGFSYHGTTDIVFIEGNMNTSKYCDVLAEHLLPVGPLIAAGNWIFQQDNAAIHTSREAKEWFRVNNVDVLEWPSRSPDLNPIENLWGWLVRAVYRNGRQFRTRDELKEAIRESWNQIPLSLLQSLIDSMTSRLTDVIKANGGSTRY